MSEKEVFLSSTGRDLKEHREAVYKAIERLDGWHCIRMESFGARDESAEDFCRASVKNCDLFVGIVGHLYGSCPPQCETSYTEGEYNDAVKYNKPRLMFVAPADFPLAASIIESDEKNAKQRSFHERVDKERVRDEFNSPDDLAAKVVTAIRNWESRQKTDPIEETIFREDNSVPLNASQWNSPANSLTNQR